MVQFLTMKQENGFRRFVNSELAHKYEQYLEVRDELIVKGGAYGDEIMEALKVSFFPAHSRTEYLENRLTEDIHRYIYENDLGLVKNLDIEKDVYNGEIRYNLIYTYAGDYHNCDECQRKCKQGKVRCLYFTTEAYVKKGD